MSTIELLRKIKRSSKTMTKEDKKKRLVSAHILTENGEYDPRYFSYTTVQSSKK